MTDTYRTPSPRGDQWTPLEAVPIFGKGRSFVGSDGEGDRFAVRYFQRKGRTILGAQVRFGPGTEGGPTLVHGGAVSSVLEELLGRTAFLAGQIAVTANLSVNYRRPVPLNAMTKALAWVRRVERRKVYVAGRLLAMDGTLLADAEGLFVRVTEEAPAGRPRDLAARFASYFAVEPVQIVAREPRERIFEGSAGNRLVADTWGNPNWPPIVFLHGGGQTRHSWGGAAYTLAQHGWYTLSLDQRGHGDSDWTREDGYRTDTYKADLNSVLRDLNAPPALVGASLGGITSLVTVGEAPQPERQARGLVLVDVTPRLEAVGVDRIVGFMESTVDGFDSIEAAGDAVAAYRRHRSRPKDLSGLRKNLRKRDDGRYYWHWDPEMLNMAHESGYQVEERLRAAARRITIPTLLVRGGSSDVVSETGV